ncbi:hypothetical protein D910_11847 [Dendroctonus ponderosae]
MLIAKDLIVGNYQSYQQLKLHLLNGALCLRAYNLNRPHNLTKYESDNLVNEGRSQRRVASLLPVRQSAISRTVKCFNEIGSYCGAKRQGRKKSVDARDERYLMQVALKNDWKNETRVSLNSPYGRERVWRRQREMFAACNISPKMPFFGESVMFWGGKFNGRTDLVHIRKRSMNSLGKHFRRTSDVIGSIYRNTFLFMRDNVRPQVAREIFNYVRSVNIPTMDWPPRSPDMNPMQHLWDALKRSVRQHIPASMNLRELEQIE